MMVQIPPEESQRTHDEPESTAWAQEIDVALAGLDWPVWIGRIFGWLIVVIALAVGIKFSLEDGFWVFIASILVPMGIGFLILVMTEVLNRLSRISR